MVVATLEIHMVLIYDVSPPAFTITNHISVTTMHYFLY